MLELMPCAGLANRMRAIASAAAAAEHLGRGLRIGWKVDPGIQTAAFSELFDVTVLPPWIVIVELGWNPSDWNTAPEANSPAAWDALAKDAPAIPFKSWAAFYGAETSVWLRYLRGLKPIPHIRDQVAKTLPTGAPLVGVHLRRTDHRRSIRESPSQLFWDEMSAILAEKPETMFYLASDDERERSAAKKLFPGRVITGPATLPGRSTVEGCQGALVDLLCLSRCDTILGSAGSSFSEIAAAYGGRPLVVLKKS